MFSIVYFRLVFMKLIFIIICGSMAIEIGNYSQYIEDYKWCGISRNAPKYWAPSNCFAYHKDFVSSLKDARTSQFFEAPWMVSITGQTWNWLLLQMKTESCGGVLIADKWVLTAAHCLKEKKYKVYLHHEDYEDPVKIEGLYSHPDDTKHRHLDIGLIKMERSLKSGRTGRDFPNTICLPPKDFRLRGHRYAMVSGFGGDEVLRIGPMIIAEMPNKEYKTTGNTYVDSSLYSRIKASELRFCPGDSGSPIWIYHMGRAVLMGILSGIDPEDDGCSHYPISVFVPYFIDWILDKIENN